MLKNKLSYDDPDFYEWETHIFFDDCMERSSEIKGTMLARNYIIINPKFCKSTPLS
jgi:hypothetical protein